MKRFLITILIVCMAITCAIAKEKQKEKQLDDLFGIQILDNKPTAEVLWNVRYDANCELRFSYKVSFTNPDIQATAQIEKKRSRIVFWITNGSKIPIELNYLIDDFYIKIKNGSIYKLKSISENFGTLNPDGGRRIDVLLPMYFWQEPEKIEEITQALIVINYGDTIIGLLKVDKSQIEKEGNDKE